MRVLVCNWRDPFHPQAGGAEVYTHEVLRRWVARGIEVVWFCAAVDGRPQTEHLDGIEIVRGGGRHSVYRAAREYYESQSGQSFDLIIDEVNTRPFLCHRWAVDTPVVALIHQVAREVWFQELPLPIAMFGRYVLEPLWLNEMRHVPTMTVSTSSKESLLEYGMQKVMVVPEGYSPETITQTPFKPDHLTLCFVGRLARNKRPDHALAVHSLVRRQIPDAELLVIGNGAMMDELQASAGPGVTFLGRVPTSLKNDLVSRAHALIVTSVREGWALVVDESAHLGTPSVGYDVAGLRDSIPAARGLLVEPRPEALAAAIVANAPQLLAVERRQPWSGGALHWDVVADEVLHHALSIAELPRSVGQPERRRVEFTPVVGADRRVVRGAEPTPVLVESAA